ncbi:MAG: hypothetical protein J5861_05995, partial [Desulfovibrio sp.]|nr:hypothetical protein [Desulfovibrio sp.]
MSAPGMLVIAHGHPHFGGGGGEIAAYNAYQGYAASGAFSRVSFLASTSGQSGALHRHADNEYLWDQNIGDDFTLSALHQDSLFHRFASFLEAL